MVRFPSLIFGINERDTDSAHNIIDADGVVAVVVSGGVLFTITGVNVPCVSITVSMSVLVPIIVESLCVAVLDSGIL